MIPSETVKTGPIEHRDPDDLLTPKDVVDILRLDVYAPRHPMEALRNLVRRGRLKCLRRSGQPKARYMFLRRHVQECLAGWAQWGDQQREKSLRRVAPPDVTRFSNPTVARVSNPCEEPHEKASAT